MLPQYPDLPSMLRKGDAKAQIVRGSGLLESAPPSPNG
jgi:hypothetical protein